MGFQQWAKTSDIIPGKNKERENEGEEDLKTWCSLFASNTIPMTNDLSQNLERDARKEKQAWADQSISLYSSKTLWF